MLYLCIQTEKEKTTTTKKQNKTEIDAFFPSHSRIVTKCINFKKCLYMLIMEERNLPGIAR